MTPWNKASVDEPIDRSFQARFLLRLLLLFASGTIFLYLVLFVVFSRKLSGDYPSIFFALRHFATFLFPVVAISVLAYVLVLCGAASVLSVYAMNKVAGPLYRMERVLEGYIEGQAVKPVFFREGDQLHPVARDFNRFVGRLREDRNRWIGVMEHADRLCLQDQDTCKAEMMKSLEELERQLLKYH